MSSYYKVPQNVNSKNAYSTLNALSGSWVSNYTTANTNSANWDSAYGTVSGGSYGSADGIDIIYTPTNYTAYTADLSGHLSGIDVGYVSRAGSTMTGNLCVTNIGLISAVIDTSGGFTFTEAYLTLSISNSTLYIPLYYK